MQNVLKRKIMYLEGFKVILNFLLYGRGGGGQKVTS